MTTHDGVRQTTGSFHFTSAHVNSFPKPLTSAHTPRWTLTNDLHLLWKMIMGAGHKEPHTSRLYKIRIFFNKYSCFSFEWHVSRLILESEGKKDEKTDPRLFLAQNKLLFIKVSHVDFEVAWNFCETLAWFVSPWKSVRPIPVLRWGWWAVFQHGRLSWAPPSWILNSPPDWLKFVAAILDYENNRVYCSRINSLLSFSAPDWVPVIWAWYSSSIKKKVSWIVAVVITCRM